MGVGAESTPLRSHLLFHSAVGCRALGYPSRAFPDHEFYPQADPSTHSRAGPQVASSLDPLKHILDPDLTLLGGLDS